MSFFLYPEIYGTDKPNSLPALFLIAPVHAELQKIRRCVDIALRADQPEQTQSRTKRHEQER